MDSSDLKGKRVTIFGLGILGGGVNAAKFFASKGALVTISDQKNQDELADSILQLKRFDIRYSLGGHKDEDFLGADLVIKNPAIPYSSKYLKFCRDRNIPIETEASLFVKLYPYRKNLIGVTGTRGKSTTTAMIAEILQTAGYKVRIGGNVKDTGTISFLDNIDKDEKIVLELSSWQLSEFKEKSVHIAVITNIYEDHLNKYKSMEDYVFDKQKIFLFQKSDDFLVLNKNLRFDVKSKIVYFEPEKFSFKLKLLGLHNVENASAAFEVAKIAGVKESISRKVLENFKPLFGRLEKIKEVDGVEFINDTTSTTPIAGLRALKSIDRPIILIAGGNSKKLNYQDFVECINSKVKRVIFLSGDETENFKNNILESKKGEIFNNMEKAVKSAFEVSSRGDTVLLSPGFTSFGIFKNEFDRGEKFNNAVYSLK